MNSRRPTPKISSKFLTPGIIIMLLALLGVCTNKTYAQDLDPVNHNYRLVSAGSYVIAMDNALQQDAGNGNLFNLKAYGLAATLMDNRIALYWAIRAGKAKDDTDFSAMTTQVFGTTTNAVPTLRQFRAGPFIAQPTDTIGFDSVVTAFNTANPTNKVSVSQMTQATWVDIRYTLLIQPRAALLNDGGNASFHVGYMTKASIPNQNYEVLSTGAHLTNPDSCFTFASEPHNDNPSTAVADSIRSFMTRGGNFLAQCNAITDYENATTPGLQTSRGVTGTTSLFGTNLGATTYPHPDLSFTQYQGTFDPASISVASFCAYYNLNNGSVFINNGDAYDRYTGSNAADIGQSVAKLDTGAGHLVFYTAGHNYGSTNDANNINGIRSYFNAMFTPSSYNVRCAFLTFSNDLAITKTAQPTSLIPGQNDTFTVIITNNGPSVVIPSGVIATDTLPVGFTYVSSHTSKGTYSNSTHTWIVGTMPLQESDTLVIVATAVTPGTITNTAFINAEPFDFNQTNDTAHATVIVHSCMTVNAGNDTAICLGKNVVLGGSPTVTGGSAPYTYVWLPTSTLSAGNIPNPTATPITTTTYSVTVTDVNTCSAVDSITITVNPLPTPTMTLSSAQICTGGSDTLFAGGGVSYVWSTAVTTDTIIVSPVTSTPYTVTVTDMNHCTASITKTVIANPPPTPPVTVTAAQICNGYKDTLIASGGSSYLWSNTLTTDTIIVSPSTTTTYSVTVTDIHHCTASVSKTVTVIPSPNATITPTSAQICIGNSDTLTAASGGTNYAWSTAANTASIIVSPTSTTPYTVTVTGFNACTASATVTVTVNPLPTPTILLTSPQICSGSKDTLIGGGGSHYIWNNTANTDTIIVSPTATTTYSVTVTDSNSCSAPATKTVIVNPLPTATITIISAQICIGNKDTLIAGGGLTYLWSNTATTDTITVSPANTTSYSVTVTDANHCTDTITRTVVVNPLPTPSIAQSSTQICIGQSDTLTASGGVSYSWSNASNTNPIIVSPVVNSTYTVTVTDANSCSATVSKAVTVNPLPTPGIALASVQVCSGNADTLIASGGISYVWSNTATTDTIFVSPLTTTLYTVTVTDANACSDTASKTVVVNPLPAAAITPTSAHICIGNKDTLTASGGGTYLWSNAGNTSTIWVSPLATTNYTVTVTGVNTCTATAVATVIVNPLPDLSLGTDTVVCMGISYDIPGLSSASTFIWVPDSGLSDPTSVSPVFFTKDSVNYSYMIIAIDTTSGCIDTGHLSIGTHTCISYIIGAQAFTPNGDGTNDHYTLFSSQIASYEISIYNRWGELVYQSSDLSALNDTSKGWDGSYQGKQQPADVFVYYLTAKDNFNKEMTKKGNITLLR